MYVGHKCLLLAGSGCQNVKLFMKGCIHASYLCVNKVFALLEIPGNLVPKYHSQKSQSRGRKGEMQSPCMYFFMPDK